MDASHNGADSSTPLPAWGQQPPAGHAGGAGVPGYGAVPAGGGGPVTPGATSAVDPFGHPLAGGQPIQPMGAISQASAVSPAPVPPGPVSGVSQVPPQVQYVAPASGIPVDPVQQQGSVASMGQPAAPAPNAQTGVNAPGQSGVSAALQGASATDGLRHAAEQARRIMDDPHGNPYLQAKAFERLKAEYLNTYRQQAIKISSN